MNTQNSDGADGQLEAPVGPRERNPLFVPGVMRCAKCNFALVRTNLYVQSGTTGQGNNETEPCPNGCGPLWPVTWEQEAREGYKMSEDLFDRAKRAEDALRELVALEDMRLRLRSLHERGHGTDYEHYHKGLPKAWDAARALLAMLTKEQQAEAISKAREALGHNADVTGLAPAKEVNHE